MAAESVTGTGLGSSDKPTLSELGIAFYNPSIVIAGRAVATSEEEVSPPSNGLATIMFPSALPNPVSDYVIMLTTVNGGSIYVTETYESGGNFSGFSVYAEASCSFFYLVATAGLAK